MPGLATREGANAIREPVVDLAEAFIAVEVVHAWTTDQGAVASSGAGWARVAAAHPKSHTN